MSESLFIQAPGKVNLALAVGPVNPDGGDVRHPICSWMMCVNLFDDMTLTRLAEGTFSRYAILWAPDARRRTDIDWSITRDLTVRAHLLLEAHVGRRLPVQMKLEKRIPVGSGLGGGSSDAAAMLAGCNALFGLELEAHQLAELAAQLGSDVPFFLGGPSTIVEGFGERRSEIAARTGLNLVLCFPEFSCATGEVYQRYDELLPPAQLHQRFADRAEKVRALAPSAASLGPEDPFNDLAAAAFAVRPELRSLADAVAELAERPAHVTGSGSALFLICDDPIHADHLADAIERKIGVGAVAVRGLGSDERGPEVGEGGRQAPRSGA